MLFANLFALYSASDDIGIVHLKNSLI